MFKFPFGPAVGVLSDLSSVEVVLSTSFGMMTSVLILAYGGEKVKRLVLKRFFPNRKLFSKRTRRFVRVWRKFGIWGLAFLTPVVFGPIIGPLLAASFGESKKKIFISMFAASLFWSLTLFLVYVNVSGLAKSLMNG